MGHYEEGEPYKVMIKGRARRNPSGTYFYENISDGGLVSRKIYITYSEVGDRYFFTQEWSSGVVFLEETKANPLYDSEYMYISKRIPMNVYAEIMNNYLDKGTHWSLRIDDLIKMDEDSIDAIQMMSAMGGTK